MKHRYYFICFFTVLFSSCFFKKEQNLDCQNFKSLNEYLIFQNFKYEDIKDISVHYIDSNGLKKVVNIHHDSTDYNHRYNSFLGNKIHLTKGIEYFVHTKKDIIKLKIDSFEVHHQNTMVSRNQVCGLGTYSINNVKIEAKEIIIDKEVIDTSKLK
jgi:hypothetical protein